MFKQMRLKSRNAAERVPSKYLNNFERLAVVDDSQLFNTDNQLFRTRMQNVT